jgi:selenide,water dikinase
MRLHLSAIPILDGVRALAEADVAPGGTRANAAWVAPHVRFEDGVPPALRLVLADAQTNGGLFAAVPAARLDEVVAALGRAGVQAAAVGEVVAGPARLEVGVG